jgi:hypothetical protein
MHRHWAGAGTIMPKYRIDQALQHSRHVATHIRRHGGSPLAAAYAQIEAAFSPSASHARFKERVAALIRLGPTNPEVRMRYRILAERHRAAGLADAIALVEGLRDGEITARAATARNWGANGRPRLALMILDELRLILRVVRRFVPACFPAILAAVLAAEYAEPA